MRILVKYLLLLFLLCFSVFLVYFFMLVKPSNSRNWEVGYETLPGISISSNQVSFKNLRDYHYTPGKLASRDYLQKSFDITQLERAWFVFEPFQIQPFTDFKGVAHTYLVFDFNGSEPVAVSVEARREEGEQYSAWLGLINKFELFYVWGTEVDQTVRRVIVENNKLYMYPLQISREDTQSLFLRLAEATGELEVHPRFYNTLSNNCTNELAYAANRVSPNLFPLNLALFLPGYSVDELYKLGLIPTNLSIDDLNKRYFISDLVKKLYLEEDFSKKLRENLL